MHRIDDAGRGKLVELGVSRVIDLRSDHEIDAAPNLVDGLGITVHRVPVSAAAPTAQIPQDITLGALCRNIVDVPDGGSVVVHCTAGKTARASWSPSSSLRRGSPAAMSCRTTR